MHCCDWQTDRQTDRRTDGQMDSQKDRQQERQLGRERRGRWAAQASIRATYWLVQSVNQTIEYISIIYGSQLVHASPSSLTLSLCPSLLSLGNWSDRSTLCRTTDTIRFDLTWVRVRLILCLIVGDMCVCVWLSVCVYLCAWICANVRDWGQLLKCC